jgi:DNA polymerase III delta subunit
MASSNAEPAVRLDASMRIVILKGPEQYLRESRTRRLVEVLEAEHGSIDQFVFDGAAVEPAVVLDELRSYGLLQAHKLVIVDDADRLVAKEDDEKTTAAAAAPRGRGRSKTPKAKTKREMLEAYAAKPTECATLLLRASTWRKGKLDDLVKKVGAVIDCKEMGDADAVRWCVERCADAHDAAIAPDAAGLLVGLIGPGLARLDVELGKLAAFVGPGGRIGADEIRALVGLSREEQAWEIQSALLSGRTGEAVLKLRELLTVSRQPEQLVMWAMTDLLRKLHAAAQLLRQGAAPAAIGRQLRLWGPATRMVIDAGRRLGPEPLAQLLRVAIETDQGTKSGLGSAPRSLESLAVRIADTIRAA